VREVAENVRKVIAKTQRGESLFVKEQKSVKNELGMITWQKRRK